MFVFMIMCRRNMYMTFYIVRCVCCYNKWRWHPDTPAHNAFDANTGCLLRAMATAARHHQSCEKPLFLSLLISVRLPSFVSVKVEWSGAKKRRAFSEPEPYASSGEPIYLMTFKYSCCARSRRLCRKNGRQRGEQSSAGEKVIATDYGQMN